MGGFAQSFVCADMEWEYEIDIDGRYDWSGDDPWLLFKTTHAQRDRTGEVAHKHWQTRLSPNLFPVPFAWSGMYVLGGQNVRPLDGEQYWGFSLNVPDPGTFRCKEIWAGVPMGFYKRYGFVVRGRDELKLWTSDGHPSPYLTFNLDGPGMKFVDEVPETVQREIEDRIARIQRWIRYMQVVKRSPMMRDPVPTVRIRTRDNRDKPHHTQCPVCLKQTPSRCNCVPYRGTPEAYPTWAEVKETLAGATWNGQKMLWEVS